MEINLRFCRECSGNEKAGVAVRVSEDGGERVEIYYSPEEKKLIMDTTACGGEGRRVREEALFELREGENLFLDILIDKSVIEVYANKRQAICRRAYPSDPQNAVGIKLIGKAPDESVPVRNRRKRAHRIRGALSFLADYLAPLELIDNLVFLCYNNANIPYVGAGGRK